MKNFKVFLFVALVMLATVLSSSVRAQFAITGSPINQAPVVNAGPDQTIRVPTRIVYLTSSVTDDGVPRPASALLYTWSGPANVNIVTSNAINTLVTFPNSTIATSYIFTLTVSDSLAASTDTVVVTVLPRNRAPISNAGPDQSIQLPTQTTTLAGSATDDGIPELTLTYSWSGPTGVTFSNTSIANPVAMFPNTTTISTNYALTLTVSDGDRSGSDTIVVTVRPALVANAGPDVSILLPTQTYQFSGSATGGAPPYTYTWSGPEGVSFDHANTANPVATFPNTTTRTVSYLLTLSVRDSLGNFNTATVKVRVNPIPSLFAKPILPKTITLPINTLALAGAAFGGIPPYTYTWSGPPGVSFNKEHALRPVATFPSTTTVTRVYTLHFTVMDSVDQVASSSVNITVNPLPIPPLVTNAGADVSITLPTRTLQLASSASGGTAPYTYIWSGPAEVSFDNPSNSNPIATFPNDTTNSVSYALNLKVTDSLNQMANAVVTVTVRPGATPFKTFVDLATHREDEVLAIYNDRDLLPHERIVAVGRMATGDSTEQPYLLSYNRDGEEYARHLITDLNDTGSIVDIALAEGPGPLEDENDDVYFVGRVETSEQNTISSIHRLTFDGLRFNIDGSFLFSTGESFQILKIVPLDPNTVLIVGNHIDYGAGKVHRPAIYKVIIPGGVIVSSIVWGPLTLSQSDIQTYTDLTVSSAVRSVDGLITAGITVRNSDSRGRPFILKVTDTGLSGSKTFLTYNGLTDRSVDPTKRTLASAIALRPNGGTLTFGLLNDEPYRIQCGLNPTVDGCNTDFRLQNSDANFLNVTPVAIEAVSLGGFVIVGNYQSVSGKSPFLMLLDSNGFVLSRELYSLLDDGYPESGARSVKEAVDGYFTIGGFTQTIGGMSSEDKATGNAMIFQVRPDGTL